MDQLVTAFRSADEDAQDDATEVAELLKSEGIEAVLLNDDAVGVPEGAWEVRVPAADAARAEALIAGLPEDEEVDPSEDLDLVTVFESGDGAADSESEAYAIKNLLESAGLYTLLVGADVPIPSLNHQVQVAKEHEAEARRLIAEARAEGRAAAETEAESSS
jgi:hypothetical protein